MKKILILLLLAASLVSCASVEAHRKLNSDDPDEIARGNPQNTANARAYLVSILAEPEGREVKAYERRAYAATNPKSLFVRHGFYVFFNEGKAEHTLVFTGTPSGSEYGGAWMLDARTDLDSYADFAAGGNSWELTEYRSRKGRGLDLQATVEKIIARIDERRNFFGGAHVRDLPWYHHLWMALAVPPPILAYAPFMFMSIGKDSCLSAVLETMVFE
jgi:hypothetical protein